MGLKLAVSPWSEQDALTASPRLLRQSARRAGFGDREGRWNKKRFVGGNRECSGLNASLSQRSSKRLIRIE